MTGTITFNTNVENIIAYSGPVSILKYLPNITGLIFDNNTNITNKFTTL